MNCSIEIMCILTTDNARLGVPFSVGPIRKIIVIHILYLYSKVTILNGNLNFKLIIHADILNLRLHALWLCSRRCNTIGLHTDFTPGIKSGCDIKSRDLKL